MADVRDKILYSKESYDGASEDEMGQRFVTRKEMKRNVNEGNTTFMTECKC